MQQSPTFNLMHQYKIKTFDIYHFDLYRLDSKEELNNIGIEDVLRSGISILEWGGIARGLLHDRYIKISFEILKILNIKNDIKEVNK